MSSILVLDLETVLDKSLPAPPELSADEKKEGKKPPFPAPPLHQIVCAGWAVLDSDYKVEGWGVMGDKGESEVLIISRLIDTIERLDPVVVTLNGRTFDLPVLAARSYVLGLTFRWYYAKKFGARYRYSREDTYDVMDFLSDHGAARPTSLDVWAKAIGWPGKPEGVSGASVQEMWDAKRFKEIWDYCGGCDIPQSIAVLLRTELLRGALDLDGYREAANWLLEKAEADPRTAPAALSVDRARFLLDEGMNDRKAAE